MRRLNVFILYVFMGIFSWSCSAQVVRTSGPESENPVTRLDSVSVPVKILRVIDGDTAEIIYHDLFLKVRLAHIDAPESRGSQPFGRAAGRYLRSRIEGQEVVLRGTRQLDKYGRFLATIYKDGVNINKEMVQKGYAWYYEQYSSEHAYRRLQDKAQADKKGLWQDRNPVAPWDYRKGKR